MDPFLRKKGPLKAPLPIILKGFEGITFLTLKAFLKDGLQPNYNSPSYLYALCYQPFYWKISY